MSRQLFKHINHNTYNILLTVSSRLILTVHNSIFTRGRAILKTFYHFDLLGRLDLYHAHTGNLREMIGPLPYTSFVR